MKYLTLSALLLSLLLLNNACKKDDDLQLEVPITVENLLGEWEIFEATYGETTVSRIGSYYTFGSAYNTSGINIIDDSTYHFLPVSQPLPYYSWELYDGNFFRIVWEDWREGRRDYYIFRLTESELWLADDPNPVETYSQGVKFRKKQ